VLAPKINIPLTVDMTTGNPTNKNKMLNEKKFTTISIAEATDVTDPNHINGDF